jgi:hypothetical protein
MSPPPKDTLRAMPRSIASWLSAMPFLTLVAIALDCRPGGHELVERGALDVARAGGRARARERAEGVQPQLAGPPLGRPEVVLLAVDRLGEHVGQADDVVVVDVAHEDRLQEQRLRAGRHQRLQVRLQRRLVDARRTAVDEHEVVAVMQHEAVAVFRAQDVEGERGHGYTDWIARRMSSIPWPW